MAPFVKDTLTGEWIDNAARAFEQGGMTITDAVSDASIRKAIALTRGMESMIDDSFGRVLSALEQQGFDDDTVVLFTSDHGEFLGQHGLLHKGPPPYQDLNRVSFIAAGPGIPQGHTCNAMTSHLDIMPTLLDLAGVNKEGVQMDGLSLRALFDGGPCQREALYLEFHPRIRQEMYNHSIWTGQHRLTLYPSRPHWGELFDLESDPGEHHNVFHEASYAVRRDQLIERLGNTFPAAPDAGSELVAKW